jgi:hypothetical protein
MQIKLRLPTKTHIGDDVPGDDVDAHVLKLHFKVREKDPIIFFILYLGLFL